MDCVVGVVLLTLALWASPVDAARPIFAGEMKRMLQSIKNKKKIMDVVNKQTYYSSSLSSSWSSSSSWSWPPHVPGWNDNECGVRLSDGQISRVVGGDDVDHGDWPWQAMLCHGESLTCGGTFIGGRYILTAAHCFDSDDPTPWKVNLGKNKFGKCDDKEEGEFGPKVEKVIVHSSYDDVTHDNDIAIMVLKKYVTDDASHINRACLDETDSEGFNGDSDCYITGWGKTSEDGVNPDYLQQAKAPLIDRKTCEDSAYAPGDITTNMLCAGYLEGGIDTCQGDSGGPLVCKSADSRWYLVGITSWGNGCASEGYPGIYTDVSKYIDWIGNQIEKNP